jgi:hypothetical protein
VRGERHLVLVARDRELDHVPAERLIAGPSVHLLGRAVPLDDAKRRVRGDDGGGHLVEQPAAQLGLVLVQAMHRDVLVMHDDAGRPVLLEALGVQLEPPLLVRAVARVLERQTFPLAAQHRAKPRGDLRGHRPSAASQTSR